MRNRVRADGRLIIFPLLREGDEYYFSLRRNGTVTGLLLDLRSLSLAWFFLEKKSPTVFLITAYARIALIDFKLANRNTTTTNLWEARAHSSSTASARTEFFV